VAGADKEDQGVVDEVIVESSSHWRLLVALECVVEDEVLELGGEMRPGVESGGRWRKVENSCCRNELDNVVDLMCSGFLQRRGNIERT
jgi:hypothetical protein